MHKMYLKSIGFDGQRIVSFIINHRQFRILLLSVQNGVDSDNLLQFLDVGLVEMFLQRVFLLLFGYG